MKKARCLRQTTGSFLDPEFISPACYTPESPPHTPTCRVIRKWCVRMQKHSVPIRKLASEISKLLEGGVHPSQKGGEPS
ncbi:hypothetical protein A3F07_03150 [candidate division WWE3 bacterium RIFCSPHIGHO2_12_FULL_38_15]|nr:MAG: hypothetical protein A2793_04200 [candidate division WWE3 bacterium RIFCSPHIGHO2_01_FULL_38_45]OGC49467.1 MAG: hypothetical protein A3F07_03150 [candidate division WWE3 bacterium RIFCSPHIGHO2_12_FULL_38_15]